jgi:hypothetical protein
MANNYLQIVRLYWKVEEYLIDLVWQPNLKEKRLLMGLKILNCSEKLVVSIIRRKTLINKLDGEMFKKKNYTKQLLNPKYSIMIPHILRKTMINLKDP